MKYLELHRLEQGECLVIAEESGRELLMVDCGGTLKEAPDAFGLGSVQAPLPLLEEYRRAERRFFLLTHYHKDRFTAMQDILRSNPNYFSKLYFPFSPCDVHGHPLLLEYGIFMEIFLKGYSEYDEGAVFPLFLFLGLPGYPPVDRLQILGKGDTFSLGNIQYEILWPPKDKYTFGELFASAVEEMNICVSSPFLPEAAKRFREWKEELCREWLRCAENPSEKNWERGKFLLSQLPSLREELCSMPFAPDIREILNRPMVRTAHYAEMDGMSFVLQNRRVSEASLDDILLTGDATPETMDKLAEELYEGYFVIQAPGKGQASHWSHVLGELSSQHLLLSGSGEEGFFVAEEYMELPAMRHCAHPEACRWFRASGRSCSRMNICYDLEEKAALSIQCPFAGGAGPAACGCRIFVRTESGKRSCICDGLPVVIH